MEVLDDEFIQGWKRKNLRPTLEQPKSLADKYIPWLMAVSIVGMTFLVMWVLWIVFLWLVSVFVN